MERSGFTPKKGGQEGVRLISGLDFTTQDGNVLFREVYTDGTKSPLKPIPGLDSSMPDKFKIEREKMIEEYRKKGLWADN